MKTLPQPWSAAMEATMFTGWIYDHLRPHAAALKVAHPLMRAPSRPQRKRTTGIDAGKICDCLRCDFLPECYMASTAIRERRRTLRYRNLLVRQMVQMKIKISALLMENGGQLQQAACTRPATFANCWQRTRTSMKGCARCCDFAAKRWCAWGRSRVLWCDPWSATRCWWNVWNVWSGLMTIPAVGPDHGADLGAGSWRCAAVPRRSRKPSATAGCVGAEKSSGNTGATPRRCPNSATSFTNAR